MLRFALLLQRLMQASPMLGQCLHAVHMLQLQRCYTQALSQLRAQYMKALEQQCTDLHRALESPTLDESR